MVFKWRKRYQEAGLEGFKDLPRSGAPRRLGEAETLDPDDSAGATRSDPWEPALNGQIRGRQCLQVAQVWAAADLKPHRLKIFKISNDPHFADKVVDVVGLYLTRPTTP